MPHKHQSVLEFLKKLPTPKTTDDLAEVLIQMVDRVLDGKMNNDEFLVRVTTLAAKLRSMKAKIK